MLGETSDEPIHTAFSWEAIFLSYHEHQPNLFETLELRIVRELHGIEKGASEKEKGETVRAKEIVASSQSFKGATSEDEGGEADKRQEVIKRAIF